MDNQLFLGDCLEIMPTLPDKSVDLILCDLPYGTTRNKWDKRIPPVKLWQEYLRLVKDRGAILLFAQLPFDKELAMTMPKLLRYEWIWIKTKATGHLNAHKMPLKKHENILVFYKQLPKYNPQFTVGKPYVCRHYGQSSNYDYQRPVITENDGFRYPTSVLEFNTENGLHPTQKPVMLCQYLIKTYTDEGDTVLDNCMGSGTTGVACVRENRKFIGIESDEKYFKIAKERIGKEKFVWKEKS